MEQIHTDTEIEDEGENAQAEEDPQEEVVGLWGYLWEEINRGQVSRLFYMTLEI